MRVGSKNFFQYSLTFFVLICLLNTRFSISFAQNTEPQIIIKGGVSDQQMISSDSQYFIHSYKDWISYNVTSHTETHSEVFPISTSLSSDEHQLFADTLQAYIFESPDHRYIAYSTLSSLDGRQKLALGDRKLLQKHVFEEFVIHDPYSISYFSAKWSLDSSTFIITEVTDYGSQANYIYISNFSTDISKAKLSDPNHLYHVTIQKVYDLTQDGQSALLLVATGDPDRPDLPTKYNLSTWDSKNPETIHIIDDIDVSEIISASFAYADDNRLLVATHVNLIEYDLKTHTQHAIEFPFDVIQVESLLFAPNGKYLITSIVTETNATTYLVPLPLPIKKA